MTLTYLLAGHTEFTVENTHSKKHYSYYVERAQSRNTYRVYYKYNSNDKDYRFLAIFFSTDNGLQPPFKLIRSAGSTLDSQSIIAITFGTILSYLSVDKELPNLVIHPSRRCAVCRKKLTTPESLKRGMGPECFKEAERQRQIKLEVKK